MAASPPTPFVGRAGKMLSAALRLAGLDRATVRVMNAVPVRAPHDKFAEHDLADIAWAKERFAAELAALPSARVFVGLGANPTEWLLGGRPPVAQYSLGKYREGFIGEWRGSRIRVAELRLQQITPEAYLSKLGLQAPELSALATVVPTFHPAAVLRQFTWHPWFLQDINLVAKLARGEAITSPPQRQWFINQPEALEGLLNAEAGDGSRRMVDLIATDTELEPEIISIVTHDEVHVFEANAPVARAPLTKLLTSPRVVKVAHNWLHDAAFFRKRLGIVVQPPIFDTMGGAHITNVALEKSLSPHIATRYTAWPYHKWLVNVDPYVYCGMDGVVSFDAYWPQITELHQRKLMPVAVHDHKLLVPLIRMQATGFRVDEAVRQGVEQEYCNDSKTGRLDVADRDLTGLVDPLVEARLACFEKPHLFRQTRSCECCGGGKIARSHCWRCAGLPAKPRTKRDYANSLLADSPAFRVGEQSFSLATTRATELRAGLPTCRVCSATGKSIVRLAFNSESSDQLADVVYRGLGIRPRRFKGVETVKAAQLDPIKDQHSVIAKIVEVSQLRAEYETIRRLRAGSDGLLHCVFDPFGTASGRVAGKEGLLEVGTNPMNLPKAARRFVIPRDGKVFLYPDMEQIEARAVAVLSKDKNLIAAFTAPIDWPGNPKHGKVDSHTRVVQLMSQQGVHITRDQAKRLTYAAIYGGQAAQLAQELNAEAFRKGEQHRITPQQMQVMLDTFFKVFNGVRLWQQDVLGEVLRTRKLRCPVTGRERTWLGYVVDTKTKELKHEIAKQVWSFLPQNMAAWVLGLGLQDIANDTSGLLVPLIHVHDALLIEAPAERQAEAEQLAIQYLSRYIWGMSFPAGMKSGKSWLECS